MSRMAPRIDPLHRHGGTLSAGERTPGVAQHPVLRLQAHAGNAAVARLIQRQATTTMGTPPVDITQIPTARIESIIDDLKDKRPGSKRTTDQITLAQNYVQKRKAARAVIDTFAKDAPADSPHFDGIKLGGVVEHLEYTIEQPHLINQKNLAWCGPNTFLMVIARNDPVAYACYVTDLYTNGRGSLGGLDVQPGTGVKTKWTAPQTRGADWIALGSLRDAGNWFFSATDKTIGFATFPGDITGWFAKYGVPKDKIVQKGGWITQTDAGDLADANKRFGEGWNVLLWVHMFTLKQGGQPEDIRMFDIQKTHWVVMNGEFAYDTGARRWSCPVNTWGGKGSNAVDVSVDRISSSVFGFIAVDMNAQVQKPHT